MAKDRKIDVVILGLLSHEDLTGYDIKKRIDGAISFFWKGSFGSIYPALNAMEQAGQISKYEADDSGSRKKILYHITAKGTKVLKQWLNEEQASNELKYETLLKLYFGGVEAPETTVHNIEIFEERIKELDPDNDVDGLRQIWDEVYDWGLPKARKDLREFNKKIAEKLPDVANIIKF